MCIGGFDAAVTRCSVRLYAPAVSAMLAFIVIRALQHHVAVPSARVRNSVDVSMRSPLVGKYCPLQYPSTVDTAQGSMSRSRSMDPGTSTTSNAILGLLSLRSWT